MDTARRLALVLGCAVVALAGAVATWTRLGPVVRGTGWAEDSGIFLRERFALGPVDSLLHPYAGYLHLLPRLVVDLGVARPIDDYALTVSAASCAVVGLVCGAVFVLSRDVVRPWPLRALLGLVPAFLPLAPVEIAGNAANLHWFLLFAAPWVFAARPRTWWGAGGVALLALAVTLSEVQTVVFVPLLLLGWSPGRDVGRTGRLRALPHTAATLLGAGVQLVTAATNARVQPGSSGIGPLDLGAGYLAQAVGGAADGDVAAVARAVVAHGWGVVAVPFAVLVTLLVVAVVLARWRARVLLVALVVGSALSWSAGVVVNPGADLHWATAAPSALTALPPLRYAASSSMFLLAAAVVAAAVLVDRASWSARVAPASGMPVAARAVAHTLGWVLVAAVVATFVVNVHAPAGRRADGPEWRPQFDAALVARCVAHPAASVPIDAAPWGGDVPCRLVLRDR